MWQDLSCQPPLMISTAKSFGYMAKYFCTKLPTSLNAFCPQKYHHSCPGSQRIWVFFTSEIWDGQMSAYPYFLEWRVEKCRSDLFVLRTSVFSNFLLLYDDKLWLQAWLHSKPIEKRRQRHALWYCDIGILWYRDHLSSLSRFACGGKQDNVMGGTVYILWWEGRWVYIYGFGSTELSWFL